LRVRACVEMHHCSVDEGCVSERVCMYVDVCVCTVCMCKTDVPCALAAPPQKIRICSQSCVDERGMAWHTREPWHTQSHMSPSPPLSLLSFDTESKEPELRTVTKTNHMQCLPSPPIYPPSEPFPAVVRSPWDLCKQLQISQIRISTSSLSLHNEDFIEIAE